MHWNSSLRELKLFSIISQFGKIMLFACVLEEAPKPQLLSTGLFAQLVVRYRDSNGILLAWIMS